MRTQPILAVIAFLSLVSALGAQAIGPDVIVGELNGIDSYGTNAGSGIWAYAVGTTSCNVGNAQLIWIAGTNQHPVIGQNLFRLKNGRFEQIGLSWLKHAFTALQGSLCATAQNPCQPSGTGAALGIFCSDPYGAGLNGSQGNGPRNEVNASTGVFNYPFGSYPAATPTIGRRIQCATADVDPAQNAGALWFAEGQYVTQDDAAAGNKNNNASYRRVNFTTQPSPLNYTASFIGATVQQQPAIMAWQVNDPTVVISFVDVPNDGRYIIAKKVTSLGGGNHHYEFAIQNLNSDASGRGFTVDFPAGTTISNAGFKDVNYHSGEPYSGTDWTITPNGASINWATQLYIQNPNANALRWGTLYNFWCDANAASETNKTIELFKPYCPVADPVVPNASGYTLNAAAAFDNPTLTAPLAGPSGDDVSVGVPIGFTFNFYGVNYTNVNVCTNGFLSFTSSSNSYTNACLPGGGVGAMVAGYWDDLITPPGSITYQTLGVAPNRRFVASWNGIGHYGATGTIENFKIILDETTNLVTSTIVSSGGGGSSGTRGIRNSNGTAGTQASCNSAGSAIANTSQTYTPYNTILPSADLVVSGSTGPNGVLNWFVNSNALGAPVILIASLDPGPTPLGALGTLDLGLTPGLFVVLADGAGILQPANPAHTTDACGDMTISLPLGPGGLPPGLTIYNQGVILSNTSNPPPPNGQFHFTDMETLNT